MSDYYDRKGQPITLLEWAALFEDKTYQHVRQTWTRSGALISTVWIGLDHRFSGTGPPVIFETMIFHDGTDVQQDRHCTEAEALAHHEQMVRDCGGRDDRRPTEMVRPKVSNDGSDPVH